MTSPASPRVTRVAALFYVPMLASGLFLRPPGVLRVSDWRATGWGLLVAWGAGVAVVAASRRVASGTRWGAALREEMRTVLGGLGGRQILLLSLLSAFAEEMLFRGVLHGALGLWPTALLFGLMHFPLRRALLPWTFFALVLGVGLGFLTDFAASLWPAVFLHFYVNYFNLHELAGTERDGASGAPTDP